MKILHKRLHGQCEDSHAVLMLVVLDQWLKENPTELDPFTTTCATRLPLHGPSSASNLEPFVIPLSVDVDSRLLGAYVKFSLD
uniref:Uncharacterized protein n=1 Tax=Solanum tuberosum TaxID=4113 RepID=M1DSC5_SOLTU